MSYPVLDQTDPSPIKSLRYLCFRQLGRVGSGRVTESKTSGSDHWVKDLWVRSGQVTRSKTTGSGQVWSWVKTLDPLPTLG